jgi:hypothetical protein
MRLKTGRILFTVSAVFILFLVPVLFSGCGSDSAPDGSTITIFPKDFKLTDGGSSVTTTTQNFTISVHNADGLPLNDVELVVLANGQEWGVAQMMTTGNSNLSNPATVFTGDDGTYTVRIQLLSGGGMIYKFQLEATSGTAGGLAKIDVKASTGSTGGGGG